MMNNNLVYAVSLVVLINCVISVANNDGVQIVNSTKNATDRDFSPEKLNENIFSEGNSLVSTSKSRIKPRKGAIPDNSIEIVTPSVTTNITQDAANKNIISDVPASSSKTSTLPVSTQSISNVTVPSIITSTLKPPSSRETTTTSTSSSSLRTLATKKPVRKPTITYAADDNSQILESEKNIKYINVTNIEDATLGPKTSSDTDRTIVEEEQRTRRNYIIYMGLAFALPMAFTLVHFTYKRIRNWMEIRHYERVVSSHFAKCCYQCLTIVFFNRIS